MKRWTKKSGQSAEKANFASWSIQIHDSGNCDRTFTGGDVEAIFALDCSSCTVVVVGIILNRFAK
jgi:hypothetical protein